MKLQLRGVQRHTALLRFPIVTIETEQQPELELELERLAPPPMSQADGYAGDHESGNSGNSNDTSHLHKFIENLYTNDDTVYDTIFGGDTDDNDVLVDQWVEIVKIENNSVNKGENNND